MDAYANTVSALQKIGYDFETYYGTDPRTGRTNFNAKQEIIHQIVDFMLQMKDKYDVNLGTCAESLVREGISKEGCLSVNAVNEMLGTSIEDKGVENNTQRVLCSCYGGKTDALKYNASCASHCVYCYAKHENDKALQYYNEDGTLKDNVYTRTSASLQEQSKQEKSPLGTKESPIQIYSDGSDIKGTGQIGYGSVFEYDGQEYAMSGTEESDEIKKLKQLFPNAKFSNPTMEMLALATTLETIADAGIGEHIQINQDYKGAVNYSGLWNHSEGSNQRDAKAWNPKEAYIKHLVERAERAIEKIEQNGGSVKIVWVKGHQTAGTEQARMNDRADFYAKNRSEINTLLDAYNTEQENLYEDWTYEEDSLNSGLFDNPNSTTYSDKC